MGCNLSVVVIFDHKIGTCICGVSRNRDKLGHIVKSLPLKLSTEKMSTSCDENFIALSDSSSMLDCHNKINPSKLGTKLRHQAL